MTIYLDSDVDMSHTPMTQAIRACISYNLECPILNGLSELRLDFSWNKVQSVANRSIVYYW